MVCMADELSSNLLTMQRHWLQQAISVADHSQQRYRPFLNWTAVIDSAHGGSVSSGRSGGFDGCSAEWSELPRVLIAPGSDQVHYAPH